MESNIDVGLRTLGIQKIRAELARRESARKERDDLANRLDEIRENCKTFHGFMRESWHVLEPTTQFKDNWHLGAICDHLEAVHRKDITGLLVVNQPPGTMKSLTVSVLFNAWEWGPGGSPGLRYLTASYREDLTIRDSRKSRNLIKSEWYQTLWPNVKLIRSGDSEFENNYFGRRKAIPFMSLTGDRGNRVIIDDPHSLKQAESEVERPGTVQLFREMVPSRINDPLTDVIVVMMQRVHPEDICGTIEELNLPAVKLILPMEYVRSLSVKTPWFEDPRTEEGELLHPDRYPRDKVEKDKITFGAHAYDTQYQQQPRARDGSYYFSKANILVEQPDKTFAPVQGTPRVDAVYAVIDSASKVGAKRDGTGVMYFGFIQYPKKMLYVLDWDLQQMNAAVLEVWLPNVLKRCEELAVIHRARAGSQGAKIEDKDSGIVLLQKATEKRLLASAIPSAFTALGKEGRAVSVSGYVYNGLVKFTQAAYDKVVVYKGRSKNHAVDQITTFRMGHGTPLDEDELFDCFCYGAGLAYGDYKGT